MTEMKQGRGVDWSILPAWGSGDPDSNSGGPILTQSSSYIRNDVHHSGSTSTAKGRNLIEGYISNASGKR